MANFNWHLAQEVVASNDIKQCNNNELWQSITLLHDAMPWQQADKDAEWQFWLQQMAGTTTGRQTLSKHGHYFNRTDMAMAAAAAGLGVALARCALFNSGLTAADLAKEGLVSPFSPIDAQAGYYLIQHHHSPAIACFKAWLKQQALSSQQRKK